MSSIDIAIVALILLGGAMGIYWGIIRQALSIVGVIAGVVAGGRYGPFAADSLSSFTDDRGLAQATGFLLVFVLVSGGASVIASLLHQFVGLMLLGWLDHLLGGLAGVVQGVLACGALVLAAATFPNALWSPALVESRLTPVVAALSGPVLLPLLPDQFDFAAQKMLGLP